MSQYLLADTLGLSAVHINRVLRELREGGTVTFQNGQVVFGDFEKLVAFADFDRGYLDHDGPLLRQGTRLVFSIIHNKNSCLLTFLRIRYLT